VKLELGQKAWTNAHLHVEAENKAYLIDNSPAAATYLPPPGGFYVLRYGPVYCICPASSGLVRPSSQENFYCQRSRHLRSHHINA
jgi:hypothetical protein